MAKLKAIDASTKRVEKEIVNKYASAHPRARVSVYRYNSASIRVRVIDTAFKGKSIIDRETEVLPIIQELPDDLQDQITMLYLVTPEESERSLLSAEFDNPTPSRL